MPKSKNAAARGLGGVFEQQRGVYFEQHEAGGGAAVVQVEARGVGGFGGPVGPFQGFGQVGQHGFAALLAQRRRKHGGPGIQLVQKSPEGVFNLGLGSFGQPAAPLRENGLDVGAALVVGGNDELALHLFQVGFEVGQGLGQGEHRAVGSPRELAHVGAAVVGVLVVPEAVALPVALPDAPSVALAEAVAVIGGVSKVANELVCANTCAANAKRNVTNRRRIESDMLAACDYENEGTGGRTGS